MFTIVLFDLRYSVFNGLFLCVCVTHDGTNYESVLQQKAHFLVSIEKPLNEMLNYRERVEVNL